MTPDEAEELESTIQLTAERLARELWMAETFMRRDIPMITDVEVTAAIQGMIDGLHRNSGKELVARQERERQEKLAETVAGFKQLVREPGEGSTWHRLLDEDDECIRIRGGVETACGRIIDPAEMERGRIGEPHVLRVLVCRACLRMPDDLTVTRRKRRVKRRPLRRP